MSEGTDARMAEGSTERGGDPAEPGNRGAGDAPSRAQPRRAAPPGEPGRSGEAGTSARDGDAVRRDRDAVRPDDDGPHGTGRPGVP